MLFLLVEPHPMSWSTSETDPFWGPHTPPEMAVWITFPENSPTGIKGNVLLFIIGTELRFGQPCDEQFYLFGETVYSAWRIWKMSPFQMLHGHVSLVPSGRYWWPQVPSWRGDYDQLPSGSRLNVHHSHQTPEEYNDEDPAYNPPGWPLSYAIS